MTEQEQDIFERQLRDTKPAKLSAKFSDSLRAAVAQAEASVEVQSPSPAIPDYPGLFRSVRRWLVPAAAVGLVGLMVWRGGDTGNQPTQRAAGSQISAAPQQVLKADAVKIDQQLVSSFDAVARLSSGEPVRFRCENWMDQVVLSDKEHGVIAENRRPRFEVVALGFETY